MKKYITTRNITITASALLAVIILISVIFRGTQAPVTPVEETTVDIFPISTPLAEGETLSFSANVTADNEAPLTPQSSGTVDTLYVEEGATLTKGDPIFSLERNDQRIVYKRAEAQLENQRIILQNLQEEFKGIDSSIYGSLEEQQEQKVAQAYQDFLNNDLQAYPQEDPESQRAEAPIVSGTYQGTEEGKYIIETYASSSASGASVKVSGLEEGIYSASTNFPTPLGERGLYLQFPDDVEKNTTWIIEIPNTRSSSYITAKNTYTSAQSGKDVTLTQSQVTQADINQQQNVVRQQELSVQQAAQALADMTIRAPFDGVLVDFDLSPGSVVSAYSPVGRVKSLGNLNLEFSVSEQERSYLQEGSEVLFNGQPVGSITYVAQSFGASSYKSKVRATLFQPDTFTEGEIITIEVLPSFSEENISAEGVITVPITALHIIGNDPFLATLGEDDTLVLIPVETGLILGSRIEIISGINGTERVVSDARGLEAGQVLTY